jgi:crotonobetainyl-CoA:carnitine CoA-transferase CaiB-like acyl-CoA transferase
VTTTDSHTDSTSPPVRALEGLRVVDLTCEVGELAGRLLADLGAEVVKVEAPGGDDTRSWQPPVRDGVAT